MVRTRQQRAEATRQRILAAAADAFSRHGFRATTVREICRLAQANVAAVKYYFGSKAELYLATFRWLFGDAAPQLPPPRPITTAEEWEAALYDWAVDILRQVSSDELRDLWRCRLFSRERSEPSAALPLLIQEFFQPRIDRLEDLLRLALPPGAGDTGLRLWSLSTLAQCTLYAQKDPPWDDLLFPADLSRQEWVERLARHVVAGVTCRLAFRPATIVGKRAGLDRGAERE